MRQNGVFPGHTNVFSIHLSVAVPMVGAPLSIDKMLCHPHSKHLLLLVIWKYRPCRLSLRSTYIFSADALVKLGINGYIQLRGYWNSSIPSKSEEPLIKIKSSSMVHKG